MTDSTAGQGQATTGSEDYPDGTGHAAGEATGGEHDDGHVKILQERIRVSLWARALAFAGITFAGVILALDLMRSWQADAPVAAFCVACLTVTAVLQTRLIRRLRREEATALHDARPRGADGKRHGRRPYRNDGR